MIALKELHKVYCLGKVVNLRFDHLKFDVIFHLS